MRLHEFRETPPASPEGAAGAIDPSLALRGRTGHEGRESSDREGSTFSDHLDRETGREAREDDPPSSLSDPDRDTWTQQVIGRRIHWQYGPDGRRIPFLRQRTVDPEAPEV